MANSYNSIEECIKRVDRDRLKIARQAAADASIQLDDSQRGYNSAAEYLDGEHDDTSIAIRSALNAVAAFEARIAELEAQCADAEEKLK